MLVGTPRGRLSLDDDQQRCESSIDVLADLSPFGRLISVQANDYVSRSPLPCTTGALQYREGSVSLGTEIQNRFNSGEILRRRRRSLSTTHHHLQHTSHRAISCCFCDCCSTWHTLRLNKPRQYLSRRFDQSAAVGCASCHRVNLFFVLRNRVFPSVCQFQRLDDCKYESLGDNNTAYRSCGNLLGVARPFFVFVLTRSIFRILAME